MNLISIIGIFASCFTPASLLPQLFKLVKQKKAEDISMGMLAVLFIGLVFWVWYGCLKKDWIIIISNSISIIINVLTAALSLKYKTKK